jgi:hypothetical protein
MSLKLININEEQKLTHAKMRETLFRLTFLSAMVSTVDRGMSVKRKFLYPLSYYYITDLVDVPGSGCFHCQLPFDWPGWNFSKRLLA